MKKINSNKLTIIRLIVALILFLTGLILQKAISNISKYYWLFIFIPAYLIVGVDVLIRAVKNLFNGKFLDENFLMSVASIGAFAVGAYPEAIAVMLFYQVGELFQRIAVQKSRKSISSLMDIRPDYANLKNGENIEVVSPFDVNIGDLIVIKAGEKAPLDAVITEGVSTLNVSALTGESLPKNVGVGDEILSGSININGLLVAKVTKIFSESTASKILDLVENASNNKAKAENFITKFAKYYTPIVVFVAIILALVPPIFDKNWSGWIYRGLTFLVVSCPCALVISIPLSFFAGIGNASKNGILVKGSNYLEALSKVDKVVFDKTGTLTKGTFAVNQINAINITNEALLKFTAYAESFSSHPISKSIVLAYNNKIDTQKIKDINEIAGLGVSAIVENSKVLVGSAKLMQKFDIDYQPNDTVGVVVYVAIDGVYCGNIVISDEIKEDSAEAIAKLNKNGIKTVMLTGDSFKTASSVSNKLGLSEFYAELLPADKVEKIEGLLSADKGKKLVFVGDGINDAPVLARADIGIAMGGVGSDSAIEVADIVLMTDEPTKINQAIKLSKKTLQIVRQNIIFTLAVKFAVLALSAFGIATMWSAVFADVGVSILAILNSIRALKYKLD
ncbi:MAG: heavy metal translocating P-type ATPase [Clostridia bacterium]